MGTSERGLLDGGGIQLLVYAAFYLCPDLMRILSLKNYPVIFSQNIGNRQTDKIAGSLRPSILIKYTLKRFPCQGL
jgi:hypothetical protein